MKRFVAIAVSAAILALLYWQIDLSQVPAVWGASDKVLLAISLAFVVPIAALTGLRLSLLTSGTANMGFWTSTRLILSASVMNLVLPSKMGDVAKAVFIVNEGHMTASRALALVTFEKLLDLLALLFWCSLGLTMVNVSNALFWTLFAVIFGGLVTLIVLLCVPPVTGLVFELVLRLLPGKIRQKVSALADAWREMQDLVLKRPAVYAGIGVFSVGLWAVHLLQIWLFAIALQTALPIGEAYGLVPLAILAGLMPLTFAGVGTRDAALAFLLVAYMSGAQAALLGILCTMRYVLPGIMGLPFFTEHLHQIRAGGLAGTRVKT